MTTPFFSEITMCVLRKLESKILCALGDTESEELSRLWYRLQSARAASEAQAQAPLSTGFISEKNHVEELQESPTYGEDCARHAFQSDNCLHLQCRAPDKKMPSYQVTLLIQLMCILLAVCMRITGSIALYFAHWTCSKFWSTRSSGCHAWQDCFAVWDCQRAHASWRISSSCREHGRCWWGSKGKGKSEQFRRKQVQ